MTFTDCTAKAYESVLLRVRVRMRMRMRAHGRVYARVCMG